MILKIRAANSMTGQSWRFFDGVCGLHFNVFDAAAFEAKRPEIESYPKVEEAQYVSYWDDALPPYKVALMTFDSNATGPIEIICNTTVYLLNDTGKTIERII